MWPLLIADCIFGVFPVFLALLLDTAFFFFDTDIGSPKEGPHLGSLISKLSGPAARSLELHENRWVSDTFPVNTLPTKAAEWTASNSHGRYFRIRPRFFYAIV